MPDVEGKRLLIVGLRGGNEIIDAYALVTLLRPRYPAKLVYANAPLSAILRSI